MAAKAQITQRKRPTTEGVAMAKAFKSAAKAAKRKAFTVRKSIMVQRDGWLVMVNAQGKVVKRVKQLNAVTLPS